jgi:hypothetical protein
VDGRDTLSAGTVVSTGRGAAMVTRTGTDSALGRIAALVAATPHRQTPLQRRLTGLGRTLALVAVTLSVLVMISGLLRGLPLADMVLAAVNLTVAAVPESLPAVVTVALALGARRMARRSAILRRLQAVETLGSVTVIAADKTGTLTEGVMTVEQVIVPDGASGRLRGSGHEPYPVWDQPALSDLARAMLLCNDAGLVAPPARRRSLGRRRRPDGGRADRGRRPLRHPDRYPRPVPARGRDPVRQRPAPDDHRARASGWWLPCRQVPRPQAPVTYQARDLGHVLSVPSGPWIRRLVAALIAGELDRAGYHERMAELAATTRPVRLPPEPS